MLTDSQEIWPILLEPITLRFIPSDHAQIFSDENFDASLRVKEMVTLERYCTQIVKEIEL